MSERLPERQREEESERKEEGRNEKRDGDVQSHRGTAMRRKGRRRQMGSSLHLYCWVTISDVNVEHTIISIRHLG